MINNIMWLKFYEFWIPVSDSAYCNGSIIMNLLTITIVKLWLPVHNIKLN